MKSIISTLFLSLFLVIGFGQKRPDQFTEETSPTDSNFEVYSQKNGQVRRASLANLKKYFTPDVQATPIGYVPTLTGNTLNLMEFVEDTNGDKWYIDSEGKGIKLYNASQGVEILLVADTTGALVSGVEFYKDTLATPDSLYWHDGGKFKYIGSGGFTPDGVTITTTGGAVDTALIATKFDLSTIPSDNIYSADGTLTGNRTVNIGANNLSFTGTGLMGFGTSTPSTNFHIYDSSGGTTTQVKIENSTATGDAGMTFTNPTNSYALGIDATNQNFTIASYSVLGASDRFTITPSGNVGVGTTAPTAKTHIVGTGSGTGKSFFIENNLGTDNFIVLDNGNVGVGISSPTQNLHIAGNARITGAIYDSNNQTGTSGQILSTTATGIDWIDAVTNTNIYGTDGTLTGNRTITMATNTLNFNGGDIGVGIASPDAKLHVQDQIKIESNSATAANILLENTSTGDSYTSYQIPFVSTWSTGIDRSDDINYKISASSALETNTMLTIERLTGNVGIANDTPTQKLHVEGSARITGAIYDSNNSAGTSGQIFTSTATGTDWVDEKIKVSQTIPHTARNVSASGYGANTGFVVPTELAGSCTITVFYRFGTPSADATTGVTLENFYASGASEGVLVNQTVAIGGRTLSNTFTTTLVAGDLLIPGVGTNGGTQPLGCSISIQITKL